MTAIVSQNFRVVNAENFKDDVKNSNVYVGIGKADAWSQSTGDLLDTTPDVPNDHLDDAVASRYQMIGMQKLTAADVSHVVKRHDWATGTVYEQYDSNVADLYDKNPCFYVLTNEFKVYKCIDNNNSAQSTVQPIHTTPTPTGSATDGYIWKYMYSITTADSEKFLTNAYMPVKTVPITIDVTTAAEAATGQDKILLTEANLDIKVKHRVKNGSTVIGTVQAINGAQLDLVANVAGGSAIPAGTKLTLDFANDTDAAEALSTDFIQYKAQKDSLELAEAGGIERIVVKTKGAGYTGKPTIAIDGDGTGAAVVAADITVDTTDGELDSVKIGTSASGSSHGADYTIASFRLTGGGASTQATLRAVISPPKGHGVDPVAELGGFLVSLNTQLTGSGGGDLTIGNDFRQINIIKNPRVHNATPYAGELATASTLNPLKVLNIHSGGNAGLFAADDVITGGSSGAKAFVAKVDTEGSNNKIFYYQNFKTGFKDFATGSTETITAQDSAGTANEYVQSKGDPEVERRSGELLFLENRNPINRSATQIEDIKLILEF